ncbi:MAG: hypothetical protein K2Y32_03800 [Candidatus Obscuribacterales bacterium]|nr:hypothetical protein [Candidatus Obscuribacterales bacterium]
MMEGESNSPSILTGPEALRLALEALENPNSERAHENFKTIVVAMEARHGENQKEVAGELQKLSKEIEALGRIEAAMEFKQRTTEMMLVLSMERRRKQSQGPGDNRNPAGNSATMVNTRSAYPSSQPGSQQSPPNSSPNTSGNLSAGQSTGAAPMQSRRPGDSTSTRLVRHSHSANSGLFQRLIYLVHTTTSFDNDLFLYTRTMGGKIDWALDSAGKRYRAVSLPQEPVILLVESDTLPRLLPVYAVTDLEKAGHDLAERGMTEKETLITPGGTCRVYKANVGIAIALLLVTDHAL